MYPGGLLGTRCVPVVVCAALACGGSDLVLPPSDPGIPASITVVRGDAQSGSPGAPLPDSIVVKVTDVKGDPVPGQQVVFSLASAAPAAAVTPQISTTDADGMAGARWVLGQASGPQTVVAQVVGNGVSDALKVTFVASAASPPPPGADQLALRDQPSSSAEAGVEFGRQPTVQIRDAAGADVKRNGVPVTAAVASGTGSLGGTTTRLTDADGRAQFTGLRIDGASGAHVLIFAAAGYTSVTSEPIDVRQTSVNQPPTAVDDEYNSIEGFNHTLVVGASNGVLQNDRDPEGGQLTASNAGNPPHGSVSLNSDGSFSYTPEASFFGDDQFTYRVSDQSGQSSTGTVTIHVAPVNDKPRFDDHGDQHAKRDDGPQRVGGWAHKITPGAPNETDQVLVFEVSTDNQGLFTSGGQPAVTRDGQGQEGTLTYTPAPERSGSATVTVVLKDNGGTANGGQDTSDPHTFTIRIGHQD